MNERAKSQPKSEFIQWVDAEIERDPELRQRVDEALNEMRIEQNLVAIREARGNVT